MERDAGPKRYNHFRHMANPTQKPANIKLLTERDWNLDWNLELALSTGALHGRGGISAATREKVLKAAQALNYVPKRCS